MVDSKGFVRLPDGSGVAFGSFPLPKDHWLYDEKYEPPPMPFRIGTDDPRRRELVRVIVAAGRYAVRGATMKGKEMDFEPDALVQNLVVGMLGYFTSDGLDNEDQGNPDVVPPLFFVPEQEVPPCGTKS
jgi:hypothetical protein